MKSRDIFLSRFKLKLHSAPIGDVEAAVAREMRAVKERIKPGMRVAVTAGSRGIANIALIIRTAVRSLKDFGAEPFIIPAMGSHGGATAGGQAEVLAGYGITEEGVGAPIRSSMETVRLGTLAGDAPLPVYMDKLAFEADGVFVVNRVKPHTDFHGEHESGLAKMLCIGLGKHAQALTTHAYLSKGLREFIPRVAETVIAGGRVLGGLAIVEDGYDQTSVIRFCPPHEIMAADRELLVKARSMMPAIPFRDLDVMLIDRMGKNISGTGMDINIIGRMGIYGEPDTPPFSTVICVFDLTPESHGNALGIGLADLIPRRLYDKVDWAVTYENIVTTRFLRRGFVPVIRETDREVAPENLRLLRIRDTLHIDEILVSEALAGELETNDSAELLERGVALDFDEAGTLKPFID